MMTSKEHSTTIDSTDTATPCANQAKSGTRYVILDRLRAVSVTFAVLLVALVIGGGSTIVVVARGPGVLPYHWQLGISAVTLLSSGLGYLVISGRGIGYVDLTQPNRSDVKTGVSVAGAMITLQLGTIAATSVVFSGNGTINPLISLRPTAVLLAMPVGVLLAPLAEEVLFRNVLQKRLAESFSRGGALMIASGFFAAMHVTPTQLQVPEMAVITLLKVFVESLLLGYVYFRTRSLNVSIVAHGAYNAVVFGIALVTTAGIPIGGVV